MVKKHVKPTRKSPAAKGRSPARKPAAKHAASRKPKPAAARKRPAVRRPAGNGSKPASRKAVAKVAGSGAKPAAYAKAGGNAKAGTTAKLKATAAAKPKVPVKAGKPVATAAKADKSTAKATAASLAAVVKGVPSRKPSVGEIAAKIAGKRAEDAAHRKGKNGKHVEAPRELTPADVEARKRRLKTLIVLGKERGYLTYAEINDHLPDDILDAEQIEGIISMIGDMGIQVYDEAPDAEALLMSETPATVPAEDDE